MHTCIRVSYTYVAADCIQVHTYASRRPVRARQAGLHRDSAGDCHLVAAQRVVRPTRPLTARRATVGDSRDSTLVAFQTPSKCAAEPDLGAFLAP